MIIIIKSYIGTLVIRHKMRNNVPEPNNVVFCVLLRVCLSAFVDACFVFLCVSVFFFVCLCYLFNVFLLLLNIVKITKTNTHTHTQI